MRRIFFLWMCILIIGLQMNAAAIKISAGSTGNIIIDNVTARPGDTNVEVTVDLTENPGICGAILTIQYDEALTLVDVQKGTALSSLVLAEFYIPYINPINASWDGINMDSTEGTILKLFFDIDESTPPGTYDIVATYKVGDVYDEALQDVILNITSGSITVTEHQAVPFAAIQNATFDDAQLYLTNDISGKCIVAIYNADGKMLTMGSKTVDTNAGNTIVSYPAFSESQYTVKVFFVDEKYVPIYPCVEKKY